MKKRDFLAEILDAIEHGEHKWCDCHACRKGLLQTKMIVCPTCGNKRCPKASDHVLACTGSNEVGQAGSVYGGQAIINEVNR